MKTSGWVIPPTTKADLKMAVAASSSHLQEIGSDIVETLPMSYLGASSKQEPSVRHHGSELKVRR